MNDSLIVDPISTQPPIKTRRVYYIGGFDPRGASYYHRLYREESAKQSQLNGSRIEVSPRRKVSPLQHAWNIDAEWEGHTVNTDYRFMVWDDIVRQYWPTSHLEILWEMVGSYWRFIFCGALGGIRRSYKLFFITLIYPIVVLVIAILAGLSMGAITTGVLVGVGLTNTVAWIAGLTFLPLSIFVVIKQEERLKMFWLLRTILFVIRWGGFVPTGMNQRMDEFADIIEQDQKEHPCDEVMLVGHSVGSMISISVLARLLAKSSKHSNLELVTLGQCIPLLSLFPRATEFRQDMKAVAIQSDIPWLDIIGRADPLCSYEADPVEVSGIRSSGIKWPQRHDISILKMYTSANYKRLKLNKLRLHFQYLMSSELKSNYDYFRLTAGPERFSYQAKKTT
ncbi:MAG: hypothetical protein R8M11_04340 [Gallionella sp.]